MSRVQCVLSFGNVVERRQSIRRNVFKKYGKKVKVGKSGVEWRVPDEMKSERAKEEQNDGYMVTQRE